MKPPTAWSFTWPIISIGGYYMEGKTLADTRALQDWTIRFAAAKAEGVAEVASAGGFVNAATDGGAVS